MPDFTVNTCGLLTKQFILLELLQNICVVSLVVMLSICFQYVCSTSDIILPSSITRGYVVKLLHNVTERLKVTLCTQTPSANTESQLIGMTPW